MGYHAGKAIEGVVYCFYKITLKNVLVFYEFTGTVNYRFLTNQNARTILGSYFMKKTQHFMQIPLKCLSINLADNKKSLCILPKYSENRKGFIKYKN